MTIQIPNLGTGNGSTGDNELVIRQKYNANFSDATNAASKLVGTANGQIPLASQVRTALNAGDIPSDTSRSVDLFEVGSIYRTGVLNANRPPQGGRVNFIVETKVTVDGKAQIALAIDTASMYSRVTANGIYGAWIPIGQTPSTYQTTTASGANVVVTTTGELQRSTSSERYKDILAPLALDTDTYNNAMSLAPIVYRSTADADNPLYHYYSFSAEALGAFDKAFTFWRETETVTDADGNTTEQKLLEPVAEGLNLNALVAFLHATNIKQDKLIKKLDARIATLEGANTGV